MNQYSADAALRAAGSVIMAGLAVIRDEIESAVCVVRPPGHHSEYCCAMGFGLFNNVAAAAAAALEEGLERVLIVDWDIHHGNGTQDIFSDDKRVLYFSAHGMYIYPAFARDDQMPFQMAEYVGESNAQGFSVNCPWSQAGYGDAEYALLWERLLMPIAREFNPQLVFVSAGFDSAAGDEEGYLLTPSGYSYLLSQLMGVAGGKVVVELEGGYNIPAISYGLHACTATLLGVTEGLSHVATEQVSPDAVADIDAAVNAQKAYWQNLK